MSGDQVAAAQKNLERQDCPAQADAGGCRSSSRWQGRSSTPPTRAGWPGDWAAQWGDPTPRLSVRQVKIVRQGQQLHLAYRVKDPSPFVNGGSDWTLLFKTGDSVNFEFSTNPAARPDRTAP